MSVPTLGSLVAVRTLSNSIFVHREFGSRSDVFEVHNGDEGEVLKVLPFVVGSGRYVHVKFSDNRIGYIHESNLVIAK